MPAHADAPLLATEAAIEALRILRERDTLSVRIDAVTGRRHRQSWAPSDRCGCLGLGLSAVQPLAG